MKKIPLKLLVLAMVLSLCCACGDGGVDASYPVGEISTIPKETNATDNANDPDDTFWILTERTEIDQMNYQVRAAKDYFTEKYPDKSIEVEYLPTNAAERTVRLQRLRTDILAGKGPDLYILPTSPLVTLHPTNNGKTMAFERLFQDVSQTIHNGHFLDISSYYDADIELGKEALQPDVMEAGVLDGRRYVLPLRYDLMVFLVNLDRIEETGKDLEWLASVNILEMMETALSEDNFTLACSSFPRLIRDNALLSCFPDPVDYASGNPNLTIEELTDFLSKADQIRRSTGNGWVSQLMDIDTYISFRNGLGGNLRDSDKSIVQLPLAEAAEAVLVAKQLGVNYAILPVRTTNSSITANVTWYGAVGSSCEEPEIAYDVLRQFLTEEYQWEQNRPNSISAGEHPGMVGSGWPVRYRGATAHLKESFLRSVRNLKYSPLESQKKLVPMVDELRAVPLDDTDYAFLDFEIDQVRFPTTLEWNFYYEDYWIRLEDNTYDGYEEPAVAAEKIIKRLRYQLAEG